MIATGSAAFDVSYRRVAPQIKVETVTTDCAFDDNCHIDDLCEIMERNEQGFNIFASVIDRVSSWKQ